MNRTLKWILLTSAQKGTLTKAALDNLAAELEDISENDPMFSSPEAEHIIKVLESPVCGGVKIVCYTDELYPPRLKALACPPAALYVKGDANALLLSPSAAVVGSRDASAYGLEVTADFCRDFCEAGITVISGGARGIDSAAARTALKFGGKTVAVLGCGVDVDYPAENRELFRRIADSGGCVVSEYFFGTGPIPALFPKRNRIIAALADCCVVTEAGLRSGSLITANLAADLRKPLFAVPGNITSRGSEGTNHLIKTGAAMAVSGMQVAAELRVMLSFTESKPSVKTKFTPLYAEETGSFNAGSDKKSVEAASTKTDSDIKNGEAASAKSDSGAKKEAPLKEASDNLKAKSGKGVPEGLSPEEKAVFSALESGGLSVFEIAAATGLSEVNLAPALVMMELKGLIKKEYGEKYTAAD